MADEITRRCVLNAIAATGFTASVAGCQSAIPGIDDSEPTDDDESTDDSESTDDDDSVDESRPCGALAGYVNSFSDGDHERALEYVPHEYIEEMDGDELLEEAAFQAELGDQSIDCYCEGHLDDDEIEELDTDVLDDGYEITDAAEVGYEFTLVATMDDEEIESEQESTDVLVEIDGEGWYIWETPQSFDKC